MKIKTGLVRFSYAHVFEPSSMDGDTKEKYSVSLIIPKSDTKTVNRIKQAIKAALEEGKSSKFGGKIPKVYRNPLRDGDEERDEDKAYADSYFLNAKSDTRPGIVDAELSAIMSPEEFYSGCYGRASITLYPYDYNGSKGIAVGLNNLQKLRDGDPLGAAKVSAEDDFSDDFEDNDLF
jgi:hypothetical protein